MHRELKKPNLIWRVLLIFLLVAFALIENNPIVKLEAKLGLSPSLIERTIGVKSFFSGMTEGVHQFAHLNIQSSFKANVFAPFIIPLIIFYILTWNFPKIDSRKKEYVFFTVFICLSVVVNIVN
ncbi:MAG: DUF2752 domain-containing protein [Methylococcales symbiont of Hymedesmia sp. n. MRB-2018]|nr:MAG: DUF2752 domain-containing protein [Methylococcales symbiont of Hymedesmia sp. n. MRB-2018]